MSTSGPQVSMPTTISVDEELADELYARKARGESYADVIRRLINQADAAESGPSPDAEASDTSPTPDRARGDTAATEPGGTSGDRTLEDIVAEVAEDVLPGSGWKFDERREALRAIVEYLREHGTATPAEFRDEVYPDHTAGYTDGEDPALSWWKNAMYPALGSIADRSEKIQKADHSGEWKYSDA